MDEYLTTETPGINMSIKDNITFLQTLQKHMSQMQFGLEHFDPIAFIQENPFNSLIYELIGITFVIGCCLLAFCLQRIGLPPMELFAIGNTLWQFP